MKTKDGHKICKAVKKIWKRALKKGVASWQCDDSPESAVLLQDVHYIMKGATKYEGIVSLFCDNGTTLVPNPINLSGRFVLVLHDEIKDVKIKLHKKS